jgi:hypothetical protein
LIRHIALFKAAAIPGLVALLGLSTIALGQTRTIYPSKTFSVSPIAITSTNSIQPQIQPSPPFVLPEIAAENDYTPPLPAEPRNSLRAGRLMTATRGRIGSHFFPGPVDGRYVPPDCNMAVGPAHIVCVINSTIAFYTKTGTKTFQSTLDGSGFFSGTEQTSFVFDPKCFYDPISKRFFVIALDLDEGSSVSNALIAVSDDSNPSGVWYKYRVNAVLTTGGSSYWMDYPGYGFNKDAIVVTGNMFGLGGAGYFGVQALVIQKAPLLTGGTANVSSLLDAGVGTMQPTRTADINNDKIWGVATGGGNAMRFYAITNPGAAPVLKEIDVPVPAYSRPGGPAQSGSNSIDSLDGRTMTAHYRAGQVVAAHTEGIGGGLGVRWYDFNVNNWPASGTPSLKQSGDITGNGVGMHMPAININSFEDISVICTRSSGSIAADMVVCSRFKNDPLGQLSAPTKLAGSGSANYTSFRWGDYFSNEIDPVDDTTFWGYGMTIDGAGNYTTQIVNWTVSQPGSGSGVSVPPSTISTYAGTNLAGDPTSVAVEDGIQYQIGSMGVAQFGQMAGAQATFTIPTDSTSISIGVGATGGISGGTTMVWLLNVTTGQYDLIGSTPLPASGTTTKFLAVNPAKVNQYIGVAGLVTARVRGHLPIKPFQNVVPNPFTFKLDLFDLFVR